MAALRQAAAAAAAAAEVRAGTELALANLGAEQPIAPWRFRQPCWTVVLCCSNLLLCEGLVDYCHQDNEVNSLHRIARREHP